MGKKILLPVLAAILAISLACDFSFLSPGPTATATSTATETTTPTVTPSQTISPFPTRTSSPTLIPGIEAPVQVGDAKLLITKALRRDTFRCGETSTPSENPETEEYLIILMNVIKGPHVTSAQLKNWIQKNGIDRITLTSGTREGHTSTDTFKYPCYPRDKDSYVLLEIHLAFVIDIKAEIFTLVLPDGTEIPLDSLMPS